MRGKRKIKSDAQTITVRVPISIRKRGGRKIVLAPDGAMSEPRKFRRQVDDSVVKALARACRWREMLEDGKCATIKEIAAVENINESYVARILRLTLLAPDIVEALIEGRQSPEVTLPTLMKRFSPSWTDQRATLKPIIQRSQTSALRRN
jgi:hypothetical protein